MPHVGTTDRKSDGTFAKGKSGNAGGLPSNVKAFREDLRALNPLGIEVARIILRRARDAEKEGLDEKEVQERLRLGKEAWTEVLKYTVAKPTQKHKVEGVSNPLSGIPIESVLALAAPKKEEPKP